jgi:hypothetical protein
MWLMGETKGVEKTRLSPTIAQSRCSDAFSRKSAARAISSVLNYASTQTFIQSFYRLPADPKYTEPLLQEAEVVAAEEGWTRTGMDKDALVHKIDNFVWETQRMDGTIS